MSTFWKRMRESLWANQLSPDDVEIGDFPAEDGWDDVLMGEEGVHVRQVETRVEVRYGGELADDELPVYVHYGLGPGEWRDVAEQPMEVMPSGVLRAELSIGSPGHGKLMFCFRNEDGQWDNNGGNNWTYPLQ